MANRKKKNDIVIINKYKETEKIDVKAIIENSFKIFYEMQINKKVI